MQPGQERGIELDARLDGRALALQFASGSRIHIPDLLEREGAERLFRHLREREDWRLVFNQGETLFELDRSAQAALTDEQRGQLDVPTHQRARSHFQFRYETIRVPDIEAERAASGSLLADFARFMSSPEMLGFLSTVTAIKGIEFADAQGTAYGPGHFLTVHDNDVAGKNRLAAYVFNLTPEWRVDWGGLLMFHGAHGHVEQAFTSRLNALNIFKVPQPHSVSYVAPYVPYRLYAITGWLRSARPA